MRFIKNTQIQYMILTTVLIVSLVKAQRTILDERLQPFYRSFRLFNLNLVGRSGQGRNLQLSRSRGNLQKEFPESSPFFCDAKYGPGRRSATPPTSINQLRPGDIDIIAGMGDSLTAGNGIVATNLLHVTVENRGMSWSIGGQGTWRQYLTLPNILKEFNPNLYGYALRDGLATDRASRFNVAELGAMSRDMPYQAKVLVQRLTHDPKVNMAKHWKMLTMLIGNNDFCADMCYYNDPRIVVEMHKQNMLKTLRYLRDNVPRLMVNVLSAPDVSILLSLRGKPQQCEITHPFECPCFIGKSKDVISYYRKIIAEWVKMDREVVYRDEFNTNDFTVNLQTFTHNLKLPKLKNGKDDFSYFSQDCFHLSQKAHARSSNAIWNNLMEPEGQKYNGWHNEFEIFKCPTKEKPYISTRVNSFFRQY